MKNTTKRVRFIRFRNASQVLPVGRNSLPILRFRSRVLSRPNTRYLFPWPRDFSARNSRAKRPTPRPMTPAVNRGTASLRAINIGPPRNFRRARFFTVPTRSRSLTKSFRSNYRMPASRLSMTRNGWSRRITVPQKFFHRDTGKRIVTIPIQFHPTNDNVSEIRSSFGDKANSKRLTDSQRGSISGRSGFHSPVRAKLSRRGDPRALSAPRSFFSYPRPTNNLGFRSRITNNRQISSQFGSRIPHDSYPPRPRMLLSSRTMPSNRIPNPYLRPFFKGARSSLRSFSARNPAIPGFRSFDRIISPRGWTGASSVHIASKSLPLIDNTSGFRFGGVIMPRNATTQVTAAFMESSPTETSQSDQNSTNVDSVSNPKPSIADQSGGTLGTGYSNASGNVSIVTVSASVSSAADNTTVGNQTLVSLAPSDLSNAGDTPSGNAFQASISTTDFDRPNADAPAPDNENLSGVAGPTQSKYSSSTGNSNINKLAWLTRIVNTRESLEEAMDDGGLISRLQRSGPHTYADLMAALRKGSHFNDEVIADMQREGLWDQLLSAAGIGPNDHGIGPNDYGIGPNDRVEHERRKLAWLTEIVNNRDGLEEAMDDGGLEIRLQQTGPHTYEELMAALRKGSHFSDDAVADRKSGGEWDQFLRTAGIYSIDNDIQDRMPETENTATNIEVKTDQVDNIEVETDQVDNIEVKTGPIDNIEVKTGPIDNIEVETGPIDNIEVKTGPIDNIEVRTGPVDSIEVETGPVDNIEVETGQVDNIEVKTDQIDVQGGQTRHHKLSRGQQIMLRGSATPVETPDNIEVKTDQIDVQSGQTRHHKLSQGQQIMTRGPATPVETPDNIEVKTDQIDVQGGQTRHYNLSQVHQMMIRGSATSVDQTANSAPALVSQNEANTNSSKTTTGGSSGTVSKEVQFRSDPTSEESPDTPENAAGTNGKKHRTRTLVN